ncbi:MAG: bifunctional phosphoglucose/phosphomannose isomerase [Firmicutes bacterium]|nr:bifunctional phosphoglucose/phosphomannose isomerase [Bacillota bacterium]
MTIKAVNIDDIESVRAADPGKMMEAVINFPSQCRQAVDMAERWTPPVFNPQKIVIIGMGGSAIGGELLRAYAVNECKVPILVSREYDIPAFVDETTLVLVSSYSGNTEETLTSYKRALVRGAKIAAFSSGGKLKELAVQDEVPFFEVPSGYQPRAALGFGFFPLLAALVKTGCISDKSQEIEETLTILEECKNMWKPDVPSDMNFAKILAKKLHRKNPVIYGSWGYKGAAALRWKCQLNENSKVFSSWNVMPEMNHNETAGWDGHIEGYRDIHAVILRDREDPVRIQKRVELTKMILMQKTEVDEVWAWGKTPLAKMLSLCYFGDFASVYLAFIQGLDPTSVKVIEWLKEELAKG